MSKNNLIVLTERQIADIKELAKKTRQDFFVHPKTPIGNDIKLLLEKKDIFLCEYPYPDSKGTHTYGNITWFQMDDGTITFIGLNTSSYYDEQIFAIAHEIYHYTTKTGKAYTPEMDHEDAVIEKMADRFAAELLLPAETLKMIVKETFNAINMMEISDNKLLRFVARIQCDWWLPYQAIINRFYEEQMIDETQYDRFYEMDCRTEAGIYRRILKSIDGEISELLNRKTRTVGVSNRVIETVISNYEDGLIEDDEFVDVLAMYGKKPEDFGIDMRTGVDADLFDLCEREEP